ILTLSRLSKNDTPHSPVDLNETVNRILDDLEISIAETKACIHVHHLPTVMAIPGQMHQLFQNLISNSIKFSNHSPVVNIGQEDVSDSLREELNLNGEEYVNIYVLDNGIGFDEQYHDKIFGIFQRLEKTNYKGTGIGLAIAKKIVDNHKGIIKATSQPGKGAKFNILLPK
ncbi:MAG TPA: ATP-binding protein, partial [Chitinophagaceae bacterium]|nr:ATP-binding protein [Chitinophagaceae bacterium]